MKKLLAVLGIIVLVVVLAIGAGLYLLYANKDEIVRRGTEEGLAFVLQVPVSVGGASLELSEGNLQIDNIVIDSPSGYTNKQAMAFGMVRVEADVNSILHEDVKVINLVQVSESKITLEQKGGSSNLQDLMNNAMRFSSGEATPEEEQQDSAVKMRIDKVLIDGTTVAAIVPIVNQELAVDIPDIEVNDFGGDKETVTPAEAVQEFIGILLAQITEFGNGILPKDLLNSITGDLKNLPGEILGSITDEFGSLTDSFKDMNLDSITDSAGDTINDLTESADDTIKGVTEGVGGAAENVTKEAENTVNDLKEGVGGLFGKKKSNE